MNLKQEIFNRKVDANDYYLHSYYRLLSAIRHFDDTTNLDQRAYHITVGMQKDEFKQLHKVIYFSVLRAIGFTTYSDAPSRPALILDQDWAGSRENKPISEYPHFHGLLIVPQEFMEVHRYYGSDLRLIGDNLKSIYITSAFGRTSCGIKVDVRRYDKRDCLGGLIDYNSKLQKKIDKPRQTNSPEFSPCTDASGWEFPWEFDRQKARKSKISTLESNFENLRTQFAKDPNQFFSERYVHEFGERLSNIAGLARREKRFPNSKFLVPMDIAC